MKIVIQTTIQLNMGEADKILESLKKVIEDINLSSDSNVGIKIIKKSEKTHNFLDLPSKNDSQKDTFDLADWYKSNLGLDTYTANTISRSKVFPKELAEMDDPQILEIKQVGDKTYKKIRESLNSYFRK